MGVGAFEYVPIVGDVYDIYHGGSKIFDPNASMQDRLLGAGQAALGVGGLATLGIGSLGKSVAKGMIKGGAKYVAKHGAKKAMNKAAQEAAIRSGKNPLVVKTAAYFANRPYDKAVKLAERNKALQNFIDNYAFHGFKRSMIPYAGIDAVRYAGNALFGEPSDKKYTDVTQGEDGDNGASGVSSDITGSGGGSYGYSVGGSGSVGGLTPEQQENILRQITQGDINSGYGYDNDAMAMAQEYMYNQQMMEPYRRNLQNYIRDYNNRADLAYNQDKELALLASLTGASGLNNMIGKNNALANEANRLGLMKTSGEDLKSVGEGMQTLLGNMALARQTGLPLRAANADTKMAQLAVNKMIADDRNENKLQVAQYNGALKLQMAQERARMQMYLRSGNRRAANDSYKRLRAMAQAAGLVDRGVPIEAINAYTGLNIPANVQQSSGEVKLER